MELLPDSQTNSNNDEKIQYALHILAVPHLINIMTLMLFCIGWNGISDFSLLLPIFLSNDFFLQMPILLLH
jgi:hypothetical protein